MTDRPARLERPAAPPRCSWFALCTRPATSTLSHPVLEDVPICAPCKLKAEAHR